MEEIPNVRSESTDPPRRQPDVPPATPYPPVVHQIGGISVPEAIRRGAEEVGKARDAQSMPVEVLLKDFLSEVARKERRSLLGVSMIGIAIGLTGSVPDRIQTLGGES